jgi:murein DD-endopeptidase MepM/ murein hydrolase activator NlpD
MKKEFIALLSLSVIIAIILHYFFIPAQVIFSEPYKEELDSLEIVIEIKKEFGVPVDSFEITRDKVKRNQTIGAILGGLGIQNGLIYQLNKTPREIFDPRKVRAGNNWIAFLSADSLGTLNYFVYEHSPVEYVFFDFTDSLHVEKREKEVTTVIKEGTGVINSSLWVSMVDNGLNPTIAIYLSEIYAWTIDFFGLQKGDHFKIIYEENYVEDKSVGIGKILAGSFTHMGIENFAIPFIQDSVEHYFDFEGNSLRRAFLKSPLRYSRISSRFSYSRMHPILKIRRPHHGVDYAAPVGTPVYAIGDGRVIETRYDAAAGRMIKIRHNSVYTSGYLHLRNFEKGIASGVYVRQGDVIGYVGSSGLSTGPHLDFRIWRNGHPTDPLTIESPPVEPVKEENKENFYKTRDYWVSRLTETTGPVQYTP